MWIARAVFMFIPLVIDGGCRRSGLRRPLPVEAREEYCWWHVMSSPLPSDTVAARFANAFATIGLRNARWAHQADTAWAVSTPTALPGQPAGVLYASRIVSYQKADSTHFRSYVTTQSVDERGMTASVLAGATAGVIGVCRAIATAAAVQATAPSEATGEEAWRVWARRR